MLLKILLEPAGFVVTAQLRIHPVGDHFGAERARRIAVDSLVKDQCDGRRATDIQMVPDDLLEERPTGGRSVEYPGVGHFELAERQLVDVPSAQIRRGERGRQPVRPTPEEACLLYTSPSPRDGLLSRM